MNTVYAKTISEQLTGLPVFERETGRLRVHSVFAHGINLAPVPEDEPGPAPEVAGGSVLGEAAEVVRGPVSGEAAEVARRPVSGEAAEVAGGPSYGAAAKAAIGPSHGAAYQADPDLEQLESRLIFVGCRHDELAPCGVLISEEDLDSLRAAPGQCVTWHRRKMSLVAAGFEIRLACAVRVSSASPVLISGHERGSVLRSAEGLLRRAMNEKTGFGVTVGEAASPERKENQALADCFQGLSGAVQCGADRAASRADTGQCRGRMIPIRRSVGQTRSHMIPVQERAARSRGRNADPEAIRRILGRWVGAGPGLTPSGDDFLAGVLIADRLHPFLGAECKMVLGRMLAEGATTDVSRHYLSCALSGLFSNSWVRLTEGLLAEDESAIADGYGRVLDFGHTSGRDMIAGFLFGIQRWEKQ